eukprot:jgi/Ulvmu1/9207/UM005_0307.1
MGLFSCLSASKLVDPPIVKEKTCVSIATEPRPLVDQGTQTEDTFVQEVGVTSSTGGSVKRSACSQDLLPASPGTTLAKGSMRTKDVNNLDSLMSPPQSKSAPDSTSEPPETLMATSEEAANNSELRKVFLEFARFGTRSQTKHMDIYRFMKMCRECGLLLRQQDVSSIDLIFYKYKEQKSNRLSYAQFRDALKHIARMLDTDVEQIKAKIISSQGPLVNNITLPKFIKQHDVDCTSRASCGPRTPEAIYGGAAPPLSTGAMSAMETPSEARHRTDPTSFPRPPPRARKSFSMIAA